MLWKAIVGVLVALFYFISIFWLAGGVDWERGWLYIGALVVGSAASMLYLRLENPELIRARMRTGQGTKSWDIACMSAFAACYLAIAWAAALDHHHVMWLRMPDWLLYVGVALYVAGTLLLLWAMGVNPFFEKTARIARERGHRVIDSGPYAYVRHPGYVATILGWLAAAPLLLGSTMALIPAGLAIIVLVVRTALEDRMLRRELDGYQAYAARVRYRLLPGVW